jgi:antitoxin VapB
MNAEFQVKQERIQRLLAERSLDALLLKRASSFAWATCGAASYVNIAETEGASALLVTRSRRYLVTDNIEAPRLSREDLVSGQGWELCTRPWYEAGRTIPELAGGMRVGCDVPVQGTVDLSADLAWMRASLTPAEGERFRQLGRACAQAMDQAIKSVLPGQSEHEIAGRLGCEALKRGIQPIVNLVAADERVFAYRHPLPTPKKMVRYAMLVLCGRSRGLVCSLTRLVHFGIMPPDLRQKVEAAARIDAVAA